MSSYHPENDPANPDRDEAADAAGEHRKTEPNATRPRHPTPTP